VHLTDALARRLGGIGSLRIAFARHRSRVAQGLDRQAVANRG
jgi:hypothetical protein